MIQQAFASLGFSTVAVAAISWFEMFCLHMAFVFPLSTPVKSVHAQVVQLLETEEYLISPILYRWCIWMLRFFITERPGKESRWTYTERKVPKCRKASSRLSRPRPENVAVYTGSNVAELVEISVAADNADSPELLQQQSSDTLEATESYSMVLEIEPCDSFSVSWTV